MASIHTSQEVIERHVGRWNTDIALGWESGILGKQRIGRRLHERRAPEHFYEPKNAGRLQDWQEGYRDALRYRELKMTRSVHFVGRNAQGDVLVVRKGWSVKRGPVVTQLERQGCTGDVFVYYFEDCQIMRTVRCGI